MTRLSLIPIKPCGSYPATPLIANAADFTWTQAGASFADGAGFTMTGNDLVLVHNSNAAPQTVTVTSVIDEKNRAGDITTYSVGIGEYAVLGPFKRKGWQQTDGKLYLAASATDVEFAIISLP